MGPGLIILRSPHLNQYLGFSMTVEYFPIKEFVSELAIEGFYVAVFPGTPWLDK